jgi:hypothetical protein
MKPMLGLGILALALAAAAGAGAADPGPLTCEPSELDARSYRLTTRAQALIINDPRGSWWDGFQLGKHEEQLADLNDASAFAAERALEADPRNLMAYGILARVALALEEPDRAEAAWQRTLDGGGAVVWSATLRRRRPHLLLPGLRPPRAACIPDGATRGRGQARLLRHP